MSNPVYRNTINLYCLKCKVTIDELTTELGISRDMVVSILKEETIVPIELIPKLCQIFKCEAKDLIL